jgi:hypothetical protein
MTVEPTVFRVDTSVVTIGVITTCESVPLITVGRLSPFALTVRM